MNCLYCSAPNPPDSGACRQCGKSLPVYGAPDGFLFDQATGRYRKQSQVGGTVKTVWFDPVSGQYEMSEVVMSSVAIPPQPPAAPTPGPEGFVLDTANGLYFREDDSGMEGGAQVHYVTWYDPVVQEYAQVKYTSALSRDNTKASMIAIAFVVVLVALGIAGWKLLGTRSDPTEKPVDQPSSGAAAQTPESTAADSQAQEPVGAITWSEPLIEQAVRDWLDRPEGAITQEDLGGVERIRLRGNDVTINDDDESATGITTEERGDVHSLADIANFPALTEIVAVNNPINDLSPLAGMESIWLVHIKHCEVQNLEPLSTLPNLTHLHLTDNSITDIAPLRNCTKLRVLTLTGNQITDASALNSFSKLEVLDLQDNPVEDWSVLPEAEQLYGPPEQSASWATVYSDYLHIENFIVKEFIFYDHAASFLAYEVQGLFVVVGNAAFYKLPDYDYPVMVLSEFSAMVDDPQYVDTMPFAIPYLVKNGELTSELTAQEHNAIVYVDEFSGINMVHGEEVATFSLIPDASGDAGTDELKTMLQDARDWLESQ